MLTPPSSFISLPPPLFTPIVRMKVIEEKKIRSLRKEVDKQVYYVAY